MSLLLRDEGRGPARSDGKNRYAGVDDDDELRLLNAREAAAVLDVDERTFRRYAPPFIKIGGVKRYTRALLRRWLAERTVHYQDLPAPRRSGKPAVINVSRTAQDRRAGRSPSGLKIVDFAEVAGLTRRRPPRRAPQVAGPNSGDK